MHKTDSCWRYGLQIPKKQPHSAGQTHHLTFRPGGSRRLSLKLFILSFPSDPKTKEHNVLLLFCVRARPLFFCLSVFNLARQIYRTKTISLNLDSSFYSLWSIYYHCVLWCHLNGIKMLSSVLVKKFSWLTSHSQQLWEKHYHVCLIGWLLSRV